jgi:GMP synthase-like glutamine amidotransferase
MKIHCFQHVAFENLGTIENWAVSNNHSISYTCFFEKNISFPDLSEIDMLIVLGGFMNVNDEKQFPWLKSEKEFIKKGIDSGIKVIGICLGSQLLSASLGSKVYKSQETEIGFYPITFHQTALDLSLFKHFSNPYTVFQWHGDTFELPQGAQLLASSEGCENQAYLLGTNVLAMQFHLEMNETVLNEMLKHDGHELEEKGKYIQTESQIRANYHYLQQNKTDLYELLNQFIPL